MKGTATTRGIIVAVSPEGIFGKDGRIPWRYPGDLRRFKRVTLGTTVVMGRRTWESMGEKPLPGRRNIVISRRPPAGVECFADIPTALNSVRVDEIVWFIGGAGIYAEAMAHCDLIDVTYVPDRVEPSAGTHALVVRFPALDPAIWEPGPLLPHEDEPALQRRIFTRRRDASAP